MSSPGEFDVNVYGQLNANYTVEFSTDLVNWSDIYSFQLTSNPFPLSDPNATNAMGFYRLVLVP
jgi:long-subunit fatty acid transport protein